MRWLKITFLLLGILVGLYAISMYIFVEENKTFRIEKTVDYNLEKVYPQFSNLQNFVRWNNFFSESKTLSTEFYQPYEGGGSSMGFKDNVHSGDLHIAYENPLKTLKYELYQEREDSPTKIEVRFLALSADKTKVTWKIVTPSKHLLERMSNLWTETDFINSVDKSMQKLSTILSNKIDKEQLLTDLKLDSLIIDKTEEVLLLGVNVSSSNKNDALYKNVQMNYSKVANFITNDLSKKEDEVGFAVLVANASDYKAKEVSYFLGFPLTKNLQLTDNNFSYKTIKAGACYTIYFEGAYAARTRAIQMLLQKAKNEEMNYGELQQVFLKPPQPDEDVLMKISLPVFK